ncbi:MAG: hypothetical protein N2204_09005 [Anaerolineae bacterium]|nr:hypothetical protein [Anaerolineae bacterium]
MLLAVEAALGKTATNRERERRPLLPQFIRWEDVAPFGEAPRELLEAAYG